MDADNVQKMGLTADQVSAMIAACMYATSALLAPSAYF